MFILSVSACEVAKVTSQSDMMAYSVTAGEGARANLPVE
jgi:hypothetical protein